MVEVVHSLVTEPSAYARLDLLETDARITVLISTFKSSSALEKLILYPCYCHFIQSS